MPSYYDRQNPEDNDPTDPNNMEPPMPSDRVAELLAWWEREGHNLYGSPRLSLCQQDNLLTLAKLGAAAIARVEHFDAWKAQMLTSTPEDIGAAVDAAREKGNELCAAYTAARKEVEHG